MFVSSLEDLSDEILMEIFDSLSLPLHIYSSFFNLNERFNRVLCDARLLMSLDLSDCQQFAYQCQLMLPHMRCQLVSLRLSNETKLSNPIEVFLLHHRLKRFSALRHLTLIQITFDQLRRILADVLSLTKLVRLDIDMFDGSGMTNNELNLIVNTLLSQAKSLQSLSLRFHREFSISDRACPSLTDLTLDCCLSSDLPELFRSCPTLHSLTIKVDQVSLRIPVNHLHHRRRQPSLIRSLSIDLNDLTLADLRWLLSYTPNLVRLRLEGLSYDMNFSKSDLWQELIERQTPNLKRFELTGLRIWLGNNADDLEDETNRNLINDIQRSFDKQHPYWGKVWSVCQLHKLRPNHLSLALHARAV